MNQPIDNNEAFDRLPVDAAAASKFVSGEVSCQPKIQLISIQCGIKTDGEIWH